LRRDPSQYQRQIGEQTNVKKSPNLWKKVAKIISIESPKYLH